MNQCMSVIHIKGCLNLNLYPVVAERSASQRREVLGRLVPYHLFIKRRSSVLSLLISLVIYCHFAEIYISSGHVPITHSPSGDQMFSKHPGTTASSRSHHTLYHGHAPGNHKTLSADQREASHLQLPTIPFMYVPCNKAADQHT